MDDTASSSPPPSTPAAPASAPETAPETAPAGGPPPDPCAGLDYQGMLQQHDIRGMDAGELATIYGPAHEVVSEVVPGLRSFFEEIEQGGVPIGNDPGVMRALGSYGQEFRSLKRDEAALTTEIRALATELGLPVPATPKVTPLQIGQGLREAVQRMLDMHVRESGTQRLVKELRKDPGFTAELNRLAQEVHARSQRIHALAKQRDTLLAKREAPATTKAFKGGRKSNDQLDAEITEEREAYWQRDREGKLSPDEKARRLRTLETLYKSRFGGGDAA
jgi:hypothetical protein